MSITVLNYHDQALVDQLNTQAIARAEAAKAAEEAAKISAQGDFSTAFNQASQSYQAADVSTPTASPAELSSIFEEAASTFGVSVNLLKSIARAESNFNPAAVSHAGAVGVMQLMPATAASLGVTNSYDPHENIMGGAKLISQLLAKYGGNTSLALAAYNAGSNNVEKYGGIPPFAETQNYVQKVLSYMNAGSAGDASQSISDYLASHNISRDALDFLVGLLKLVKAGTDTSAETPTPTTVSAAKEETPAITVTVLDSSTSAGTPAAGENVSPDSSTSTPAAGV